MMIWRCLPAFMLACSTILAAATVTITGTVLDHGTNQAIEGASVELEYFMGSNVALGRATTDKSGVFHFDIDEPGSYRLEASADGFIGTDFRTPQTPTVIDKQEFDSAATPREHNVTIAIERAGAITGTLKDSDTQKPLPEFTVKAYSASWRKGRRRFTQKALTNTDEKGEFRLEVPPGDYFLQIWKVSAPDIIVLGREADYSANNPSPKIYPTSFWPSGDPQLVVPLTVSAGGEAGVGALNIAKIQPGRIRSALPLSQCPEGGKAQVSFEIEGFLDSSLRGQLQAPCGSTFTIHNLAPARYRIFAMTADSERQFGVGYAMDSEGQFSLLPAPAHETASAAAKFAEAEAEIGEGSDIDLNFVFEPTFNVTTKIDCDCAPGWQQKVKQLSVDLGSPIRTPDARIGSVSIGVGSSRLRPALRVMPPGFAIKHVLSNDSPTGAFFVPASGKPEQTATIVLTDKPSGLIGVVTRDGKLVENADVIFAPWPLQFIEGLPVFDIVPGGPGGNFRIASLSAGTWHIVAISPSERDKAEMPGVAEDWISKGSEITIAEGETRQIKLDLP